MAGQQFFLTLPSNSSMNLFPDNTLTHYYTQLAQSIHLEGTWECGLSEIFYPRSWYNVTKGSNTLYLMRPNKVNGLAQWYKTTLPSGFYTSGAELVNVLNEIIENQLKAPLRFSYEKHSEKITVILEEEGMKLRMDGGLADIMGFTSDTIIGSTQTSPRMFDPEGGLYALYVYTNLIQPGLVGDAHTPLLRIIPIKGSRGEMIAHHFEKPHYHPVRCKHIQTVEIDIRDDTGKPLAFELGKVIVKLHFRRRRRQDAGALLL
jgi:hypothetical protein